MLVGDTQVNILSRPGGRSTEPRETERVGAGGARLLDSRVLEALLLNIDASLRVYSRPQLYGWTQGMLQNLLRHELLLCALHEGRPVTSQVDCFASPWVDSERTRQLFQQDVELAAELVRRWIEAEFHPVVCDLSS